ncbi:MAG TPA: hypothetical protein VHO48_15980, partial [Anaerolineaceae bacterium]|nr:hypothetical protein [Anaerolineaceae bacterium]
APGRRDARIGSISGTPWPRGTPVFRLSRPQRVKDELNHSDMFLAVTDAIVFDLQNRELYRCAFLTLNREHIIWLMPMDDIVASQDAGGQA